MSQEVSNDQHPRPDRARPDWLSLNGSWQFAPDPDGRFESPADPEWTDTIVVPFAWETAASTVRRDWLETGWYRRVVTLPPEWDGRRVVLCFGAVHHLATVWVGGEPAGEHEGGTTPFELDVTGGIELDLVVRVGAPRDKSAIVHGKQRSMPPDGYDGVSFTPTSGIWQSVWLEARPQAQLASVALRPGPGLDRIDARLTVTGEPVEAVRLTLRETGRQVEAVRDDTGWTASFPLAEPRLWSPQDPYLYHVDVEVHGPDGVDRVAAYTGLRSIEIAGDRLLLNGAPVYLRAVLDQGYWPDTGMTPPDDAALRRDLELARELGYNCVRKHLKLEDPRWLYWADRLGILVWAEPAATSRFTPDAVAAFERQIPAMVERDGNHPCIVVWALYNEEWGLDWDVPGDPAKQQALVRAYDLLTGLDRTRPVVDNSGWTHVRTDLVDWHVYEEDPASWAELVRGLADGSLDSFPVRLGPDHLVHKQVVVTGNDLGGLPLLNSEYGGGYTSVERGWHLHWQTQELRRHDRITGYVYTELYDVEHESAGLADFHRGPKDLGGVTPADVNADTVLIVDLIPLRPGADLVAADGVVRIQVRVSHHGSEPVSGRIRVAWAPLLTAFPDAVPQSVAETARVEVKPYQVSAAVELTCSLPDGSAGARLLLWLDAEAGQARTVVDVVRSN